MLHPLVERPPRRLLALLGQTVRCVLVSEAEMPVGCVHNIAYKHRLFISQHVVCMPYGSPVGANSLLEATQATGKRYGLGRSAACEAWAPLADSGRRDKSAAGRGHLDNVQLGLDRRELSFSGLGSTKAVNQDND